MKLTKQDKELIEVARKVAYKNPFKEIMVGCALLAKNGKIYKGVNLKSSHSICAEQVALGAAFTNGVTDLETLVAVCVDTEGHHQVVSPCGVCRYMFDKYKLYKLNVIVRDVKTGEILKVKARDLLPYANERPMIKITK